MQLAINKDQDRGWAGSGAVGTTASGSQRASYCRPLGIVGYGVLSLLPGSLSD